MEGKSLQALIVALLLVILAPKLAFSQSDTPSQTFKHSSFLEPNRFTTTKDLYRSTVWLEIGYGHGLLDLGPGELGLEALCWSRLRYLSGFRFPVESADYFFGAYYQASLLGGLARFRLSHISSHLVDGTDSTVIGGASSRYSREFVELLYRRAIYSSVNVTLGARYILHQVTEIEPALSAEAAIEYTIGENIGTRGLGLVAFISSMESPISPSIAAGFAIPFKSSSVKLFYLAGASWRGNDEGRKESGVKLSIGVQGL